MTPTLVRELMTVGVATCKTSTPILDVARFLIEQNLEEMVVLNQDGEGVGVCGFNEIVGAYGREDLVELTAEMIMREGVPELPADIPIVAAAQMMKDLGVRAAYMNHNAAGITYPAAFISYRHILRSMAARNEQDLKDLGIAAERKSPIETFIQRRDEARKKAGYNKI
ncbi:MAG: CBS domain-containing protein [Anaerolineaceae bacterium]|nr:CBS domain-containing protein [Anaerolineaceae bacterium]